MTDGARPGLAGPGRPPEAEGSGADPWRGLRTLTRIRLLVAALALPTGVLFRPDVGEEAWSVLGWSLLALGLLSVAFGVGIRLRRGLGIQTYAQILSDLALVTWLSARTGGRESQFVLFFALVMVTSGLVGRVGGGLFAAAAACIAILMLPALAGPFHGATEAGVPRGSMPAPWMLIAFLSLMGVLSGVLGHRVQNARAELARTAEELARVRIDNDLILRHLTTGVLTVDGAGRVAFLNPAAEQVLGLHAEEVWGRPLATALPARLAPLRVPIEATLEDRTPRTRIEVVAASPTGIELPLGVSTNPLAHVGDVTGVVTVFQDLTEVREMERRARRNQTLAEVGALAAGIAHELRNGLKPISGSVEYLQRELKPEGESAVLMELIAVESNRLNRFVTDLLNYSRERDLAVEPIELGEHLTELCEQLSRDPGRPPSIAVRPEAGPDEVWVRGDREQLRQVWLNLANNAFEAMPEGGTLAVRWGGGGRRVVVEFEDSGPGIAPADLQHVGEPFFTTKKKGTGLGVAIAQRIVERHGGLLSFECPRGRGTIARVALPHAEQRVAQAA